MQKLAVLALLINWNCSTPVLLSWHTLDSNFDFVDNPGLVCWYGNEFRYYGCASNCFLLTGLLVGFFLILAGVLLAFCSQTELPRIQQHSTKNPVYFKVLGCWLLSMHNSDKVDQSKGKESTTSTSNKLKLLHSCSVILKYFRLKYSLNDDFWCQSRLVWWYESEFRCLWLSWWMKKEWWGCRGSRTTSRCTKCTRCYPFKMGCLTEFCLG